MKLTLFLTNILHHIDSVEDDNVRSAAQLKNIEYIDDNQWFQHTRISYSGHRCGDPFLQRDIYSWLSQIGSHSRIQESYFSIHLIN